MPIDMQKSRYLRVGDVRGDRDSAQAKIELENHNKTNLITHIVLNPESES